MDYGKFLMKLSLSLSLSLTVTHTYAVWLDFCWAMTRDCTWLYTQLLTDATILVVVYYCRTDYHEGCSRGGRGDSGGHRHVLILLFITAGPFT
jgi:hypothetical protein